MATIDSVNFGIITRESQTKSSNLFINPLPYSDSSESILLDLFGCQKDILIDGVIQGDLSTLRTFVDNIETIQDGRQTGSAYQSDFSSGTKNVFINRFNWNYEQANPRSITYSIDLIEGTDIEA